MKYLRKFQTNAQYSAATLYTPSVSLITEKTDLKFKQIVRLESLSISGNTEVLDSEVFKAIYSPIDSDPVYEDITWSIVSGDEYATIDSGTGELTVLSGAKNNEVVIRVSSNLLLNIYCEKTISVTSNIMPEYIQDGLVFNLDGTDKQASGTTVWKDKVGGITFTNGGGVTEIANGFSFSGSGSSYLTGSKKLSVTHKNYTIQVVLNSKVSSGNWGAIAVFKHWSDDDNYLSVAACYYTDSNYQPALKSCWSKPTSPLLNQCYPAPFNQIITASLFKGEPIYVNGTKVTTPVGNKSGAASNGGSSVLLGARYTSGSYSGYYTGDIYAIRVYNRQLTEEEILHNQQIDIQKYNITV